MAVAPAPSDDAVAVSEVSNPVVAAAASAAAGLTHAAAAGTHTGDTTLQWLFSVVAALQVTWAFAAMLRPRRAVLLAGFALNAAATSAWMISRTAGLPFPDALQSVESVGRQDLLAAGLGAIAAVAAAVALVARIRARNASRSPALRAALGSLLLAVAIPAMAADHNHGESHDHDHGHGPGAAGESASEPVQHGVGLESVNGATSGGHGHEVGIPARLDHEPTAEQLDDARTLIAETTETTARYADLQVAIGAGYASVGDASTGVEHFVNLAYLQDSAVLDPQRPESLVYDVLADGGRTLLTVMYILPPGSTMDDVPDVAGNLTVWHDHDDLCFEDGSVRILGFAVNGSCGAGGEPGTSPMLHVWVTPNQCGPFAGTDAAHMTGSCLDDEDIERLGLDGGR